MTRSPHRLRPIAESLEGRVLLSAVQVLSTQFAGGRAGKAAILKTRRPVGVKSAASLSAALTAGSTSTLLTYDFNASNPWPLMSGTTTNGGTAALIWGGVGTIDTEGGTTPSGALRLTATPPASGSWISTLSSGQLPVTNTITNLGLLTVAFTLDASQQQPVKLILYSYNAQGVITGGLSTTIHPAASYYNQEFSIDLSSMTSFGTGTFDPTAPSVSFNFQMDSQAGWTSVKPCQLRLDNVNYSKPAYYVSATGSNSNNGLTTATAFATPAKAVSVSKPGDIIDVMSGTYTITSGGTNAIHFSAGGTPADWVTLKNYPGQSPQIQSEWWNAILIGNGSSSAIATTPAVAYITIRGLNVRGDADYVQAKYPTLINQSNPQTNGNGIGVDGRFETHHPHDFLFENNLVNYCSGGGIGAGEADRVDIENNVVQNTSWWTIYGTSGISILSAYNFDGTNNLLTRIIRNNISSGNQTFEENNGHYSDGNGIIIDVNHNTSSLPNGAAVGRTLVDNNVSFNNGGSGIHSFGADHVDIINNTTYLNSASPHLRYGEIFAGGSSATDVRIYNNILVAPVANTAAGELPYPVNGGTLPNGTNGIVYQNNVYNGGNTAPYMGTGDKSANPQFVLASIDAATANFQLLSTSPAINDGTTSLAPSVDINNNLRYATPDVGAYEYIPPAPTSIALAAASDTGTVGDNRTKLNNGSAAARLSFTVSGTISGATIQLFYGSKLIGTATASGTTTTVTTNGTLALPDGADSITASQTFASAPSASSPGLMIAVDTADPTLVGIPVINAGTTSTASRSQIRTITWTFSEPVLATLASFTLTNRDTGATVDLSSRTISVSGNTVTLNLDNYGVDASPNLFLADANYELALSPGLTDLAGNPLDANGDGTPGETAKFDFYKLLGDFNGDRWVSNADYLQWKADYNQPVGGNVDPAFDLDGNGTVALADYTLWHKQYNHRLAVLSDGLILST